MHQERLCCEAGPPSLGQCSLRHTSDASPRTSDSIRRPLSLPLSCRAVQTWGRGSTNSRATRVRIPRSEGTTNLMHGYRRIFHVRHRVSTTAGLTCQKIMPRGSSPKGKALTRTLTNNACSRWRIFDGAGTTSASSSRLFCHGA